MPHRQAHMKQVVGTTRSATLGDRGTAGSPNGDNAFANPAPLVGAVPKSARTRTSAHRTRHSRNRSAVPGQVAMLAAPGPIRWLAMSCYRFRAESRVPRRHPDHMAAAPVAYPLVPMSGAGDVSNIRYGSPPRLHVNLGLIVGHKQRLVRKFSPDFQSACRCVTRAQGVWRTAAAVVSLARHQGAAAHSRRSQCVARYGRRWQNVAV